MAGTLCAAVPHVHIALSAVVPYVARAQRALMPHVSGALSALVSQVPCTQVPSWPTSFCASRGWCPTCSHASRDSCLTHPSCSRASCPMCFHAPRTLYLTCSAANHYDKQPLLKECYYSGFFHKRYKLPGSINLS